MPSLSKVFSLLSSRKVLLLTTTTIGVGCLTALAWKQFAGGGGGGKMSNVALCDSVKPSSDTAAMGQQLSGIEYQRPTSSNSSAVDDGVDSEHGGVYVFEENAALLKSVSGDSLLDANQNSSMSMSSESSTSRHSFKKVIVRSRTRDDNDNTELPQSFVVVDKQPSSSKSQNGLVSSTPLAMLKATRFDINPKVKGFSNEDYQNSMQATLNSLYGTNKLISNDDAKCLVMLLQQKSDDTLLKTLTTMCNLAAFTINQDLLRKNGAVEILVDLMKDDSVNDSVRLMLTQCIGNMAVNVNNHPKLQRCVPKIVALFVSPDCSELQKIMCVQALTNLSVEISSDNVASFVPVIPVVLDRLWSYTTGANLSTLKFLVNLSCSANLVHHILAAKAPFNLFDILSANCSDEVLIRSTTFFCYLCSTADALSLKLDDFQMIEHVPIDTSIFYTLFVRSRGERLESVVQPLSKHKYGEISNKAVRIVNHLQNIRNELESTEVVLSAKTIEKASV